MIGRGHYPTLTAEQIGPPKMPKAPDPWDQRALTAMDTALGEGMGQLAVAALDKIGLTIVPTSWAELVTDEPTDVRLDVRSAPALIAVTDDDALHMGEVTRTTTRLDMEPTLLRGRDRAMVAALMRWVLDQMEADTDADA